MAGLKEIAEKAGVSIKTASRAIRGEGYISQNKKDRILKIARTFNYVPNRAAQSLRTQKSNEITIVIWSIRALKYSDDFYLEQLAGIENVLDKSNITLKMRIARADSDNDSSTLEVIDGVMRSRPLGAIIYPLKAGLTEKYAGKLEAEGIPAVIIASTHESPGLDTVLIQLQPGVRQAMELLYGRKRRKICYIGTAAENRYAPYMDFMKEKKLLPAHFDFPGGLSVTEHFKLGMKYGESFISKGMPYDGVLAYNDNLALGLVQRLLQAGIKIPRQISVVGVDNRAICHFCVPNLTSIGYPNYQIGETAARMILERIAKQRTVPGRQELAKGELVVRGSA